MSDFPTSSRAPRGAKQKTQRKGKKRRPRQKSTTSGKSRRAIRKTKFALEQLMEHGTTIQTADQINTWISWFRSELGCGLEAHRQQFLSSASNFCLMHKKSSPKTPSFGVQFAVPSRSGGYEPIHLVFSGVLNNVDAHTLARSEVRFASKKC
jgi:hypothetical protein